MLGEKIGKFNLMKRELETKFITQKFYGFLVTFQDMTTWNEYIFYSAVQYRGTMKNSNRHIFHGMKKEIRIYEFDFFVCEFSFVKRESLL